MSLPHKTQYMYYPRRSGHFTKVKVPTSCFAFLRGVVSFVWQQNEVVHFSVCATSVAHTFLFLGEKEMKKLTTKKESKSTKIVNTIENVTNEDTTTAVEETFKIMKEEYGEYKLTKKMKKELAEELGADKETVNGWEKLSDVLDHVDIAVLAKKHPEAIGKVAKGIASVVGCVFPAVGIVANAVPDKIVPKAIEVAGFLTPEHLLNMVAKGQAKRIKKKQEAVENNEKLIEIVEAEEVEVIETAQINADE